MSDSPRGRFAWYDLMTPDVDAAKSFYGKLIGWTITPFEGAPEPYDMWTASDGPIGGVMTLPEEAKAAGAPPHWLSYVVVPDVDAALEQAEQLGGATLHPSMEIPNVGTFGVLQDPQGAVIAVYTSSSEAPGTDGQPPVGHMSWHELMTTDYKAAFEFYSTLFGWQKDEAMDMGEMGVYQMFNNGGMPLGGMMNKPPEIPACYWMYYIRVANVDEAVENAKSLGGQLLNGPMTVPGPSGDRVAQLMDPQGAAFALHSTPA